MKTHWRPAKSAPRDGTPILGYGKVEGEIHGSMGGMQAVVSTKKPAGLFDVLATDAYAVWMRLQKWQPLPKDPPV